MKNTLLISCLTVSVLACGTSPGSTPDLGSSSSTNRGSSAGTGVVPSTTTSTTTSTPTGGTTAGTTGGTSSTPPTYVPPPNGNPFAGAVMYANPDWGKEVASSEAGASSSDAALLKKLQPLPTAVWLDSIDALSGGAQNGNRLSLQQHLATAIAQGQAAHMPATAVFVVYNLPNRDCAAGASAGKLTGTAGLQTYKSDFIDVIASTVSQPAYSALRVVFIIEPDSLPNMVTNQSLAACAAVASANLYTDGVTYAIQKLGALPHASLYLDIAQAGWLGWPSNMQNAITFYTNLINTATGNKPSVIRGFVTNISNYVPLQEPYVSPSNTTLLNGSFYQSNPVFDELTYAKDLQQGFSKAGIPNMQFLIDTSRNGWALVNNGQPIDGRPSRGDWCNIANAGLGARPAASPAVWNGYDAFVWVKPPGESDGASTDSSCLSTNAQLDAMGGAPAAGVWFPAALLSMAHNATPAF